MLAVISDDSKRSWRPIRRCPIRSVPDQIGEQAGSREHDGADQQLGPRGDDESQQRQDEGDHYERVEGQQHQPIHRQAPQFRVNKGPDSRQPPDHVNNSAVVEGDHSSRPSWVIRTQVHSPVVRELCPAGEEQRGGRRIGMHGVRGERPGRDDLSHGPAGPGVEHVVQTLAPGAPVDRRGAQRGVGHIPDSYRPPRVAGIFQPDADRSTTHRQVATGVHHDRPVGDGRDGGADQIDQAALAERSDVDHSGLGEAEQAVVPGEGRRPIGRCGNRPGVHERIGRVVAAPGQALPYQWVDRAPGGR